MNYLSNLMMLNTYIRSGYVRNAALAVTAALMLGLASCAQTTAPSTSTESAEPQSVQVANSETAADVTAASVGTESGGAGMVFVDALTLAEGGQINGAAVKYATPQSNDTLHTVTVTRSKSNGQVSYTGTWTHTWIFRDANGVAMPHYVKGQTDQIEIWSSGNHDLTNPRLSMADSSNGHWIITGLIANPDSAQMSGSLTRVGDRTRLKNGETMSHTFTINWTNDIIVKKLDKDLDDTIAVLLGTASSDLKVTNFNGKSFERQVSILFHGDGTATLTVTRTSANGKVDTITIDVKRGIWMRDEHLG